MFCRLIVVSAFLLLMGIAPSQADPSHQVGVETLVITPPEREGQIELTLWYPAKEDGSSELFGESKIFEGVSVRRDATLADGTFPLIVLAHGGLRSNPDLAGWIASYLAGRGNLVILVHAPQFAEADAATAVSEAWLRPSDLSAALSSIEEDPTVAPHLDLDKVAAVGFFLGGTSALAVAGARFDAYGYKRSCDQPIGPDCQWFARNGVDLHQVEDSIVTKSHLDPRIKLAVVINPELSTSFARDSLTSIKIPVHVIILGQLRPDISVLQGHIPQARYVVISDAAPSSAFSQCTQEAAALLAEEGEDVMICRDGGSRSREEIQAEIGSIIEAALASSFRN